MKKIMILGASILQVPAIKRAKDMGLYVISIDMDPKAIGFEFADEHHVLSTIDVDAVLELAKKINIDGIMTLASDKPMLTVAKVSNELGLNSISEETSIKVTNKARMRECLAEHNVPIPKFKVATNKEEYLNYISQFGSTYIVKPADSSGSRGIFLVENSEKSSEAYNHSIKYSSTGEILIEEYITGPEVSVESITINGKTNIIAITDKNTTGSPYFVELGHSIPSSLSEEIQENIKKVTIAAIDALGIEVGPSHTEIKVTDEGPKIIEVGARLGGDNITTHLVPLSTGIDMVKSLINMSIGIFENPKATKSKGAAISYFDSDEGTINNILNLNEAYKIKGVNEIYFNKTINDKTNKIRSSIDRIGYVISHASTAREAIEICKKVKDEIKIEFVK